jgi:hypothetical protein
MALTRALGADQVVVVEKEQYFPVGGPGRYFVDQGCHHAVE